MFNRRGVQTGAEAQAARRAPLERETVEVAQGVGDADRGGEGDGDGNEEEAFPGQEPLLAGLGAEAAGGDRDALPRCGAGGSGVALALGDQARGRDRVGEFARRATERIGAEPLGPGVKRRVGGRVLTAQLRPDDPPERVPLVVEPGRIFDDREGEPLARQHVAWQDPEPRAAPRTPRDPELEHGRGDGETPGRPSPASRPCAAPGPL